MRCGRRHALHPGAGWKLDVQIEASADELRPRRHTRIAESRCLAIRVLSAAGQSSTEFRSVDVAIPAAFIFLRRKLITLKPALGLLCGVISEDDPASRVLPCTHRSESPRLPRWPHAPGRRADFTVSESARVCDGNPDVIACLDENSSAWE